VCEVGESFVGVIGATSLVGSRLLSLLNSQGYSVIAFSRHQVLEENRSVTWRRLSPVADSSIYNQLQYLFCAAPVWVLPDYFTLIESYQVKRIVALSSTSLFSKEFSADLTERRLAARLSEAENRLQQWANEKGVECIVLRPTMIYGQSQDKNVHEISKFIKRFGFFPLFGKGGGLRQPVYVDDVAQACVAAMFTEKLASNVYNISGGEVLSYREMVTRIFSVLDKRQFIITIPFWLFHVAVVCLRNIPRYRNLTSAMVLRMEQDLVFDHENAARDFNFTPRPFHLRSEDVRG